jgi:hypothetical protein
MQLRNEFKEPDRIGFGTRARPYRCRGSVSGDNPRPLDAVPIFAAMVPGGLSLKGASHQAGRMT